VPEIRKYSLLQVTHDKELKLYFRLTDASGTRTLRVFPIDKLISFSSPEGQLDRFNNLHVLYQTGAHSFLYSVINPDGVLVGRETHDISATRPGLRPDKNGHISVVEAHGVARFNGPASQAIQSRRPMPFRALVDHRVSKTRNVSSRPFRLEARRAMPARKDHYDYPLTLGHWLCVGCLVFAWSSRAEEVIFHLRNGDRITGAITAENAWK
jgi:hypothetical protein